MMDWIDAGILGLVEGITEFLPISSTGHLILTSHWLGLTDDATKTFEVVIQTGAILAVVVLYWRRFVALFDFAQQPENTPKFSGLTAWACLGLTSLPAIALGLLAHKAIKAYLFSPFTVALALLVGGVIMLFIERPQSTTALPEAKPVATSNLDALTLKQAFLIGCCQCFALWPGMSRSASTIIGGMFCGLNRQVAAEYSFLAAVPVIILASAYDLMKSYHDLHMSDLPLFAIGLVVSFVAAMLAIQFFITQLQRTTLAGYGWYRIALALLVFWVLH